MNALHRAAGRDTRATAVLVQADNTTREYKNNTLTRLAGLVVGSHRIHRMALRYLMKDHSHEEIDQWFFTISSQVKSHPVFQTPDEFLERLNAGFGFRV